MSSVYDENFGFANNNAANSDNLFLDNYSSVDGTGCSFNLGVIARPSDFLRLGVAYNSPTWYKMKTIIGQRLALISKVFLQMIQKLRLRI